MGVATILDLRYKTNLLEYYYEIFYGNDVDDQVKSTRLLCYDLLYDYQLKMTNDSKRESQMLDVNVGNIDNDGLKYYDLYVIRKKELKLHLLKQSWMFIWMKKF